MRAGITVILGEGDILGNEIDEKRIAADEAD
jgi:hypothetical protein